MTLRRSTTPDDPWRLAYNGASGAAPTILTMKASSLIISRLTATLCRLLSTLRDARYRTPRKTRFRLAGYAFAGRESNPLDRDERFQLMLPPPQDLAWRYKIRSVLYELLTTDGHLHMAMSGGY